MWLDIGNLFETITHAEILNGESQDHIIQLIEEHKSRLANPLSNNLKSPSSRAKIVPNGNLTIHDVDITLDAELCAETLIISDLFNLNEIEAAELVLAGEGQKVHFEGINRGLITVVCYYDAHRLLITSLRHILQWNREDLSPKLVKLIDSSFIQHKVITHLFGLLGSFSVNSEFARLMQPNVNGLGGPKHQKLLRNAIEEIHSEILECISLICEHPGTEALNICNFLFGMVKSIPAEKLNDKNLTAWLSLVKLTSSEVLNQVQDATSVLNKMIEHIRNETNWSAQAMCGTMQLACAISLRALASSPADHLGIESIKVDVDRVIDRAIRNMAFQYLRQAIIKSDSFKLAHQFLIVDELLKQLVAYFPAKLMETERNSADELAWFDANNEDQGQSKPAAPNAEEKSAEYESSLAHYENFLRCFVDLYEIASKSCSKMRRVRKMQRQIEDSSMAFSTEKSIELCRLLERARLPHHVVHSIAYLEMSAAVCKNRYTASFIFDVFSRDHHGSEMFSWETFMSALKSYDRLFREQKNYTKSNILNQSDVNRREKTQIPSDELSGIVAWLRVATKIATYDDTAAQKFSDDQRWGALGSVASIASSSVPLSLKASLIGFLTAVARLKSTSAKVWNALYFHQLCYFSDNGVLLGIQQELDERECTAKQYDVSAAFVSLISTLLEHKAIPDFAAPYIQFVIKSILSQFSSRSYNDVTQMWTLCKDALRVTLTLLESGIVEPRAISSNDVHISLLIQCLNDTPLFRSLLRIIMEDCQSHSDPYTDNRSLSSESALISLQIISRAIVLHPAIRACARVSSSDLIVASIASLVFTPVNSSSNYTLLDLVFQYLHMSDEYPFHSLYAARILRDVIASRGNVQGIMLELLKSRNAAGSHVRAVRTALCATSINYTIDDSLGKEEDTDSAMIARGETARVLLETLSDAIDNQSSGSSKTAEMNTISYYLLGFRQSKANTKELYENENCLTGLHYVLYIIEQFISTESPFSLPYSALLEPSFRLMQRLVATTCPFSQAVLCFMRSSNIIEELVTSPFVCSALIMEDDTDNTFATGVFSIRRMIAGYILHFAAVEISTMLATGHFTRPETLFRALLESSKLVSEYTIDRNSSEDNENPNLLFSLLRRAAVARKMELIYPELVHFDVNKLHELFDACLTVAIYGVPQYDVVYLDRLLQREIDSVYNEGEEIQFVRKEVEHVLEYCTEVNANLLAESASERVVSGCTALLNVFSVYAPVNFFSNSVQLLVFRNACYVLIEMMFIIGGSSLVAASETFNRMVKTVGKLSKIEYPKLTDLRKFFAPLFKSLVELLIQPGEKGIDAKVHLYKSLRLILRSVFEINCTDVALEAEDWILDGQMTRGISNDEIVLILDTMGDEIGKHLATNIADFPTHRKAAVIILTNDLLHEDLKGAKKLSWSLSRIGVPRILCEELLQIDFDWNLLASKTDASTSKSENMSMYNLLTAILITFTRFAASESGWNAMAEFSITEILMELKVFMEPPKEVFLKPESVKTKGTAAHYYVKTLDLALHVCKQLCTKLKWKKLSLKILAFIQSLSDVFQQFIRAEVHCDCLKTAATIVYEISINDESISDAIHGDNVLRQLRSVAEKSQTDQQPSKAPSAFAAPRQLFSTILPV